MGQQLICDMYFVLIDQKSTVNCHLVSGRDNSYVNAGTREVVQTINQSHIGHAKVRKYVRILLVGLNDGSQQIMQAKAL